MSEGPKESPEESVGLDKLYKPFAIAARVTADFSERGKIFAFGLGDVLSRDLRPSLCAPDRCQV